MSRWLDLYFAKPADTPPAEKNLHICPQGLPTKPTKPSDGFVGSSDPHFAKISGAATAETAERAAETPIPQELPKAPKGGFDSFGSDPGRPISQTEGSADQPRYPLFCTEAERSLDAERLGYGGRTVH
jgi:hypothetical protein